MRRAFAYIGTVAFCGCNVLSGVGDFRFTEDPGELPRNDGGAGELAPATTTDDAGDAAQTHLCPRGLGDCNGLADDGCEADLRTDKNNCGTCGGLCSGSVSTCTDGKCASPPPNPKGFAANATSAEEK